MFTIGQIVKVISATDETCAKEYIGEIGVIILLNTNGATGNTKEDPIYNVQFGDGTEEQFWGEELRIP